MGLQTAVAETQEPGVDLMEGGHLKMCRWWNTRCEHTILPVFSLYSVEEFGRDMDCVGPTSSLGVGHVSMGHHTGHHYRGTCTQHSGGRRGPYSLRVLCRPYQKMIPLLKG